MTDLSNLARKADDILDHVVACDPDGAPVLSSLAPDVCENEPFAPLSPTTPVEVWDRQGLPACGARASWAAREVAKGTLRRVGDRAFAQV